MLWVILAFICFVIAAVVSRTRHAGWAITLITAGLALATLPRIDL